MNDVCLGQHILPSQWTECVHFVLHVESCSASRQSPVGVVLHTVDCPVAQLAQSFLGMAVVLCSDVVFPVIHMLAAD